MTTKSQINKILSYVSKINTAYETERRLENIEYKNTAQTLQMTNAGELHTKLDVELNKYIIKIGLTEDEFDSIPELLTLLDGVHYDEYISNY